MSEMCCEVCGFYSQIGLKRIQFMVPEKLKNDYKINASIICRNCNEREYFIQHPDVKIRLYPNNGYYFDNEECRFFETTKNHGSVIIDYYQAKKIEEWDWGWKYRCARYKLIEIYKNEKIVESIDPSIGECMRGIGWFSMIPTPLFFRRKRERLKKEQEFFLLLQDALNTIAFLEKDKMIKKELEFFDLLEKSLRRIDAYFYMFKTSEYFDLGFNYFNDKKRKYCDE